MRPVFLFAFLMFLAMSGPALAGGDPAGGEDTASPIEAAAGAESSHVLGEGGYGLAAVEENAPLEEGVIDEEGIRSLAYRRADGSVWMDERYFEGSPITKKLFKEDGSLQETIYYIYGGDFEVAKTVHRYADGSETVVENRTILE